MGKCKPFHTMGTASFKGHRFFFGKDDYDTSKVVLQHFKVDSDGVTNHYYYDPLTIEGNAEQTRKNLSMLTMSEYEKYNKMLRNKKFAEEYLKFTGRQYMTMYPREKPRHFMWPADYIGQTHWVTTKEVHFDSLPAAKKFKPIHETGKKRILKDDEVGL